MPYNNLVSRSDAQALIPEEVSREVINGTREESAALSLFRRVPMGTNQQRLPVLSALPVAYFVNGDTGLKQTTEMAWANKFLDAEEIACIVPVPEAVLDDASFDLWGEARPALQEAIGRALDAAVFFGANKPASWPTDLNTAAAAAGNNVAEGSAAAAGGFANDVDLLMAAVEADGFDVGGFAFSKRAKAKFRQARDANGQRLIESPYTEYEGAPIRYTMAGLWPSGGAAGTNVRGFAFDNTQFVIAVRQDITYKVATEGVIQDNTGAIIYNLFQQDMVALRVTFRAAWQVANIINHEQAVEADRYPAAVLRY